MKPTSKPVTPRQDRRLHRQQRSRGGRNNGHCGLPPLVNYTGYLYCINPNIRSVMLPPLTKGVKIYKCCTIIGHKHTNSTNYTKENHTSFVDLDHVFK